MTDQVKRKTLKAIGALGAGAVVLSSTVSAVASGIAKSPKPAIGSSGAPGTGAELRVLSRPSAITNDIEVVVTNVSWAPTTVVEFTPGKVATRRGTFDFQAALESGPMKLRAGESMVIPIKRHTVVLDGTDVLRRAATLTDSLKHELRILTTNGKSLTHEYAGSAVFA